MSILLPSNESQRPSVQSYKRLVSDDIYGTNTTGDGGILDSITNNRIAEKIMALDKQLKEKF